jgi:hypothetical protein
LLHRAVEADGYARQPGVFQLAQHRSVAAAVPLGVSATMSDLLVA